MKHALRITPTLVAGFLAFAFVSGALAAEKLTICYSNPAFALIPLAKTQGFFAKEGLEVEISHKPSGFQALQAMLKGDCALSTAAAQPVIFQSLRRNDVRILANIASSGNYNRIIVRRDRGIRAPADLRGRRVAVMEGTSAHYFLDTFLIAHGLAPGEVTKLYLPAQGISEKFRRGEVDAAALWEPYILKLAKEFGDKAQVLTESGLVVDPFLLIVRNDTLKKQPAAMRNVLRALIKAEHYAREQPGKTKALIAAHYGLNAHETEASWALLDFRVSLDQPLLFILESVARWQIRQMPPAQRPKLPNFLDFLYLDALKAVKPGAVTVID
jgi:NitT/TauT family transport system substrate-binding protein